MPPHASPRGMSHATCDMKMFAFEDNHTLQISHKLIIRPALGEIRQTLGE